MSPLEQNQLVNKSVCIQAKLRGSIGLQPLIGPYNRKGERTPTQKGTAGKGGKGTKRKTENEKGSNHNNRNSPPVRSLEVSNTR